MKKQFILLIFCVLPLLLSAEDFFIRQLDDISALGGNPEIVSEEGHYMRIRMADSCYIELYDYSGDSILMVRTICAPICSSCAGIYTEAGKLIRNISAPQHSVFPLATIENGLLVWKDNTDEMLDENEKRQDNITKDEH